MLSNLIAEAIHIKTTINNIIHALWSVGISNFDAQYCPVQ